MRSFCIAKASLIFSTKNFSVFGCKVVKHLTSWPLNELIKLTMLWTTGPRIVYNVGFSECKSYGLCKKNWIVANFMKKHIFFFSQLRCAWKGTLVKEVAALSSWLKKRLNPRYVHRLCRLIWPQGYENFSCSSQLSMKFYLLISVKI